MVTLRRRLSSGVSWDHRLAQYTALVLLVLQNASVSMLTRLSRTTHNTPSSSSLYNPSAAVFVAEIIKFLVSLMMHVLDLKRVSQRRRDNTVETGKRHVQWASKGYASLAKDALIDLVTAQKMEVFKLSVPAALYATQNTLLYAALSNLDAATYQTTYQLKLLSSALFSVLFFSRSLSVVKWFALFLLAAGVAIVQLESIGPSATTPITHGTGSEDTRIGLAAILMACLTSGLAGGYFEYILKSSTSTSTAAASSRPELEKVVTTVESSPATANSLWARNLQLSIPSLLFSLLFLLLSFPSPSSSSSSSVSSSIQFLSQSLHGFTPLVWGVVLNQAVGGLLVALVIREADGVAKGFATSIAIIVSTITSSVFYAVVPGTLFMGGASLVILSTILYAFDDRKRKTKSE